MTDRRTRRVVAENEDPINGELPWVEITDDLTWGEIKRMPPFNTSDFDAAAVAIAPHVHSWNLLGRTDGGDLESLPPAREAGPGVFDCLERWVVSWLFVELRMGNRQGKGAADLQKKPTPSSDTPSGDPEPTSE